MGGNGEADNEMKNETWPLMERIKKFQASKKKKEKENSNQEKLNLNNYELGDPVSSQPVKN